MENDLTRRRFLGSGAAAGGALLLGTYCSTCTFRDPEDSYARRVFSLEPRVHVARTEVAPTEF